MRVMVYSDAPWDPTGYGTQTRSLVMRLKAQRHDIACITKSSSHRRATFNFEKIRCYPMGYHEVNIDLLAPACRDFRADVLLSLLDVQKLGPYANTPWMSEAAPWVPWTPVDHDPAPYDVVQTLDYAHKVIAYSKFGLDRLEAAKVQNVCYIPHGIELDTFKPMDQAECRKKHNMPLNRYIVGFVGDNKDLPARKGNDKAVLAFAKFHESHPRAYMYMHTLWTNMRKGYDLRGLVQNATDLVWEADINMCGPFDYITGKLEQSDMAEIYNCFDVLLAPSMAEGFGLPILEAQACGVPVITTDCTSMGELTNYGIAVPALDVYWTHRLAKWAWPDVAGCVEALEDIYIHRDSWQAGKMEAVSWVRENYDWDMLAERDWRPLMAELEEQLC